MSGGVLDLPRRRALKNGWELRLLSAWEEMEARREGAVLARDGKDAALCANAALLSRALLRKGKSAFENGEAVLKALTAGQIAHLARQWGDFDRECDPAPWDEKAVDEAKKGWSTRLMSAFAGACSRLLALFRRRSA